MDPKIVKVKRGVNLIIGDYRYKKDGKHGGKQHWRCVVTGQGCKGRLHTNIFEEGEEISILHQVAHNHMADKEKTASIITKARLCEMAEEQPVIPLPELYRNLMVEAPRQSCRTQMYRRRRQNLPPLPESIQDIAFEGEWTTTLSGETFLLHKDDKSLIFTTEQNLRLLSQSTTVFMDGTFKSCPRLFSQLYSIHGSYRDHVIPLVYCLLCEKSRATYHAVFNKIRDRMAELDLTFSPATFITDFESAIIPALQHNFPASTHQGCYFHFTQAIWRQVQTTGLQQAYDSDERVYSSVRGLITLAFLPLITIRPAFQELENEPIVEENHLLAALFTYFKQTWLGQFPLKLWNIYHAANRTNNRVEGWHSKLNRYVKKSHPNIYELLTELKKEQASTELTVHRARLGAAPPGRRPEYIRLDQQVDRLRTKFEAGEYTVEEYLGSLRRIVHNY